jgi:hypothetical protein
MKINILDAGISYRAGHHYDYGLKILKHYAKTGHDVHVYGHSGMDDETAAEFEEFGQVTRLFRTSPYEPAEEYDWYAGEIVQHRKEAAIIADELQSIREADIWIWPTIRPQEIEACVMRAVRTPMVGCVYWDPGVESGSIAAKLWRSALVSAHAAGLNLTLGSVEAELRHRFMPIVANGRFVVVPHPVDGPRIPEPKAKLKRIGFFGHQREEKGSSIVKPLLSRLVQDGYSITFQNSFHQAESPDVPGVDLLKFAKDIAVPIAECDLVVLPYDVQNYRARGSGILMECLALGIPVTAPVGTLPGRIVEQYAVGSIFSETSPRPIYRAIKIAERNYAALAANAYRVAGQFCERNGVAHFASALLAAAQ